MAAWCLPTDTQARPPKVVVAGLASCFGCQLQITNAEAHLVDVLGQIDLQYWQLVSSDPMPDDFDVVVIEGAVTTQEALQTVQTLRERAGAVIAVGACATTAGIPGMASVDHASHLSHVYRDTPQACGTPIEPRPVSAVVQVDYEVRCCPIDSIDFINALHAVLFGTNQSKNMRTMCGDCKRNETMCFYGQGILCLGLVTRAECGARCVNLGRPCNGCAGLSPYANLESARQTCKARGIDPARFDEALEMFNVVQLSAAESEASE